MFISAAAGLYMMYRCICGIYVAYKLRLCRQCAALYGDNYKDWPGGVGLRYNDINNGRDYVFGSLDGVKGEVIGKKGVDVKGVQDPILGERGRKQCPICHVPIKVSERLCKEHLIRYGGDSTKWDLWLQALVTDDQKQIDAARNHREVSTNDEAFTGGRGVNRAAAKGDKTAGSLGGRTVAHINQDEISTDTLNWSDDELDSPGAEGLTGMQITGDKNGYKYNAMAWQGTNEQLNDLEVFSERDEIENKIAAEQELKLWDPVVANVLLLYSVGHNQSEIAELMKLRQQRVSEIIRKTVKRG